MAILYAGGTIVNTTFTNTSGTRREIVDGLVGALTSAGWTTVSGGGTGDVRMRCAVTPNGYQYDLRCYDLGSGTSARLQLRNLITTQADNIYLNPQAGKVWRVIANKYQFFILVPGSAACRDFAFATAPSAPTSMNTIFTNAAVLVGQGKTDTDTTTTSGFIRTIMSSFHSTSNWQQNCAVITNNTLWENANVVDGGTFGCPAIVNARIFPNYGNVYSAYRWADLSLNIIDPMIGWGQQSRFDETLIRGQMWDSFIIEETFPPGYLITYDGRTFHNLTANNALTRHSFFVAVT